MGRVPWLRRSFRRWRAAWHDEPVTMSSELPIDVVRERLRARTVGYRQAAFRGGVKYGVLGRIGDHDIDVRAGYIATLDLRLPRLSGRLEPTATGTRVVGSIGRHLMLMWSSAALLVLTGLVFLYLVAITVVEAFTGSVAGGQILACVVPVPVAVLLAAVSMLGTMSGRREVAYLKSWLAEGLRTDAGPLPG